MSISSSLNAGVLGLSANATRLSTIADNLANANTVGYKRADVQFSSLVASQNSSRSYWAGGVTTSVRHNVSERGTRQATSTSTDFAVGGRGFMPVAKTTDPTAVSPQTGEYLLTTAGSFRPDADGFLRNAAGLYLLGWSLNADGTTVKDNPARDSFQSLEAVNVNNVNFKSTPTTAITFSGNLPAQATVAGANGQPYDVPIEYYDPLGNPETLTLRFTPTVPAAGNPASNTWRLEVVDTATAAPGVVGTFDVTFKADGPDAGTIDAVAKVDVAGAVDDGAAYNDGILTVNAKDGAGQPIGIKIGVPGGNTGITQLTGSFTPSFTKDGSQFASVKNVEIDESGVVNAVFTNGQTRPIYRVPLADVVNPDGLTPVEGNAFRLSSDSGAVYLWNAGEGPVGTMLGYSLELSTTDVAKELTNLIETQRAYSSNAKIIQTADEMLQETTSLKR